MPEYGADVAELRTLASRFAETSTTLEESLRSLTTRISNTAVWRGPDSDRFRSQWNGPESARLRSVAAALREASESLRRNAAEQESSSAASGGGTSLICVDPVVTGQVTGTSTRGFLDTLHHAGDTTRDGVRIQTIIGTDGKERFVVYLDGTFSADGPLSTAEENVHAILNADSTTQAYIQQQMVAAGITSDSDVMIVGYSQGGIHAQNIASSGAFGDLLVLTAGSPLAAATAPLSDGTEILRIEARDDEVLNALNPWRAGSAVSGVLEDLTGRGSNDATFYHGAPIPRWDAISDFAQGDVKGGAFKVHTDPDTYRSAADAFDSSTDPQYDQIKARISRFAGGTIVHDTDD